MGRHHSGAGGHGSSVIITAGWCPARLFDNPELDPAAPTLGEYPSQRAVSPSEQVLGQPGPSAQTALPACCGSLGLAFGKERGTILA